MPKVTEEKVETIETPEANGQPDAKPSPPVKPLPKGEPPSPMVQGEGGKQVSYKEVSKTGGVVVSGKIIRKEALKVTAKLMKEILGWTTERDHAAKLKKTTYRNAADDDPRLKFPDAEVLYTTALGNHRVVCTRNRSNRQFKPKVMLKIKQDILNRNYKFNGETMIVTKAGACVSMQHRGIALIEAAAEWAANYEHWKHLWPELKKDDEPYIESLIVYGVPNDAETIRTIDNVTPRTLEDIVYTSEAFADLRKPRGKETQAQCSARHNDLLWCSKMLSSAIKFLWTRVGTGQGDRARWHGEQTHSESEDFADRHPGIEKCVREFHELNRGKAISSQSTIRLNQGECAAMLYLMATSASDGPTYRSTDPPSEQAPGFNWDNWDVAMNFWRAMMVRREADGAPGTKDEFVDDPTLRAPVAEALLRLEPDKNSKPASKEEKWAVVVKAWNLFLGGLPITVDEVAIRDADRVEDLDTKVLQLADNYEVGGIDLGGRKQPKVKPPTPEEIATRARAEQEARMREEFTTRQPGQRAPGEVGSPTPLPPAGQRSTTPAADKRGHQLLNDVTVPPPNGGKGKLSKKQQEAEAKRLAAEAEAAQQANAELEEMEEPENLEEDIIED